MEFLYSADVENPTSPSSPSDARLALTAVTTVVKPRRFSDRSSSNNIATYRLLLTTRTRTMTVRTRAIAGTHFLGSPKVLFARCIGGLGPEQTTERSAFALDLVLLRSGFSPVLPPSQPSAQKLFRSTGFTRLNFGGPRPGQHRRPLQLFSPSHSGYYSPVIVCPPIADPRPSPIAIS